MKIKIEKNVPFTKKGSLHKKNYPWDKMAIGDSFVVPFDPTRTQGSCQSQVLTLARLWCNYNKKKWKFSSRTEDDKKSFRVWRVK